jgi:hypothetical protein
LVVEDFDDSALLLEFGLFAVLLAGSTLLLITLASRANRVGKGRLPKVEAVNRAQRSKERAESRRR